MAAMGERATLDMGDTHDVIGWDGTDDGLMGGWRGHGFRFGDERQLAVQQIRTDDGRRTTDDRWLAGSRFGPASVLGRGVEDGLNGNAVVPLCGLVKQERLSSSDVSRLKSALSAPSWDLTD